MKPRWGGTALDEIFWSHYRLSVTTRRPVFAFALLGLVALPSCAFANAGTPLMWAAMLHLAIGNALIGMFEGLLLGWIFKAPKGKAITFMVIANYFSAWVGGLFLRGAAVRMLPLDLNNAWKWFWIMTLLTYAMTIVLELPFIIPLLKHSEHVLRRGLRASVVVQSASYAILFGWYWMASGTSLYTRMHIVAPDQLALPNDIRVYFISAQDGDAYKAPLFSVKLEKVQELGATNKNDRLLVRPNSSNPSRWDIVARIQDENGRDAHFVSVRTNFAAKVAPDSRSMDQRFEGTWFNFGSVSALGTASTSDWKFFAGFWPIEGLHGSNEKTGAKTHF
jgi:hypothetical protein